MGLFSLLGTVLLTILRDIAPVILLLIFFQALVLREAFPEWKRAVFGIVLVVLGLTLFLAGLEKALFPLGRLMAGQLADPGRLGLSPEAAGHWWNYGLVYAFAAALGFASAIAEPTMVAVADKAHEASRGAVSPLGLRVAVALGLGAGLSIGCLRLVTGLPLSWLIIGGYSVVLLQSLFTPKAIVPLAFDAGGVGTSTVTVPLVTALGLGLASTIPGRDPLLDGFGLIASACLFPIISVMGYAQLAKWRIRRRERKSAGRLISEE